MLNNERQRLMLVEDEAVIAMARSIELEELGYSIIHAVSGEEAVTYSRKYNRLNLILMDINLGEGINGIETARLILQERNLPILFISSSQEPLIKNRALSVSPFGYLKKAASTKALDSMISSILTQHV